MNRADTIVIILQLRAILEALTPEQKEVYNTVLETTIRYATSEEPNFLNAYLNGFSPAEVERVVEQLKLSLLD